MMKVESNVGKSLLKMACAAGITGSLFLGACSLPDKRPAGALPDKRSASPTRVSATPTAPSIPVPQNLYTDLLIPKTVADGAQMLLHKQGVIINVTSGMDLGVWLDDLRVVNTDPAFGINFGPDDQNITYFFPQSFSYNGERARVLAQVEGELPLVISALNSRLSISKGKLRFSIISVADSLIYATRRDSGRNPKTNPPYTAILGPELVASYIGLTAAKIFEAEQTPIDYKIADSLRTKLAESKVSPFYIEALNPNYINAITLSRHTY